jgi:hypothetical protein
MNQASPMLLAQSISETTTTQFTRLSQMTEWWHWPLTALVCVVVLAYVFYMYARDSVELRLPVTVALLVLRVFTFACLLFVFLGLEKKTEREYTNDSRVVVMVDTSMSMGLIDEDKKSESKPPARVDPVVDAFAAGEFVKELREEHEVLIAKFDQDQKPTAVASYSKATTEEEATTKTAPTTDREERLLEQFRVLVTTCLGLLGGAAVLAALYLLLRLGFGGDGPALLLLGSVILAVASLVTGAIACLSDPKIIQIAIDQTFPGDDAEEEELPDEPALAEEEGEEEIDTSDFGPVTASQWRDQFSTMGRETRLGDNLLDVINQERGGPIAGVVMFSDGGNNAGVDHEMAVEAARDARIRVYTVGLGSDRPPSNVRVADIEAPRRVFAGDRFTVTGYVQAREVQGRVTVELLSSPFDPDAPQPAPGTEPPGTQLEDSRRVDLSAEGELQPVQFELEPDDSETGQRIYTVRVRDVGDDLNETDNMKSAKVEVVTQSCKVLLIADGPTREYRFVRNMLYQNMRAEEELHPERAPSFTVSVWLQSAPAGISQDALDILTDFPETEPELFEQFDCIVAFDPDWTMLTTEQAMLLEKWIARRAGGLILVSGRIHTPEWALTERGDPRIDIVRGLCPVALDVRRGTRSTGRYGSTQSWPLEITEEGQNQKFLWIDDDRDRSLNRWSEFEGVYGYFPSFAVKEVKPGATVLARFMDPEEARKGRFAPYLVSQFYGAGRVIYVGSGEFWRLRGLNEEYFNTLYTKMIRYVAQGQLLRDKRGMLTIDNDRCIVGDTVMARAQLFDSQWIPLTDEIVPAMLVMPDGARVPIELKKMEGATRSGVYKAQFTPLEAGEYRIETQVPESDDEILTVELEARSPLREIEDPERNDDLLKQIATETGGEYRIGVAAATGQAGVASIPSLIEPNNTPVTLPDVKDIDFSRLLTMWLLGGICGALCTEWIIRRLSKLA